MAFLSVAGFHYRVGDAVSSPSAWVLGSGRVGFCFFFFFFFFEAFTFTFTFPFPGSIL